MRLGAGPPRDTPPAPTRVVTSSRRRPGGKTARRRRVRCLLGGQWHAAHSRLCRSTPLPHTPRPTAHTPRGQPPTPRRRQKLERARAAAAAAVHTGGAHGGGATAGRETTTSSTAPGAGGRRGAPVFASGRLKAAGGGRTRALPPHAGMRVSRRAAALPPDVPARWGATRIPHLEAAAKTRGRRRHPQPTAGERRSDRSWSPRLLQKNLRQ